MPTGGLIGSFALPSPFGGPKAVTQDANGNLWIGDAVSATIISFNLQSLTFGQPLTISTLSSASNLAWNPVARQLYVGSTSSNIVIAISNTTGATTKTITLPVNPVVSTPSSITPSGIVIDYTNTVYVSDKSHITVYIVTSSQASNTAEGGGLFSPYSLTQRLTLTPFVTSSIGLVSPGALAVDRSNNLYITDAQSSTSTRVFMVSKQGSVINTLTFGGSLTSAQSIAIDISNNVYVLGNSPSKLFVYIPSTQSTTSISASNVYAISINPILGNIILNTKTSSTGLTTFNSISSTLASQSTIASISTSGSQFVMDGVGNYYVINGSTVYAYTYTGSYISTFTTTYATIQSIAIAVDASGNIWTLGANIGSAITSNSEIISIPGLGYNGIGQHMRHVTTRTHNETQR